MVALQIRDVPDDVRRRLADRAAARGQSLQSFLLALVTEEAERSANLAIVQRFAERTDGSRLSAAEVTDALDLARADREGRLAASRDPR
ncbi:FitA-like ribbon-helix-helix domain-containing protein [Jatrophihabitans sp.]|jgi:plasmid stability protein|uniref:FitA-like ribbon-helix-helix domain-containing protein n=1 Tax=Jatrophihabitans sp. TaxID=1932789 RepID=UPI002EDFB5A5